MSPRWAGRLEWTAAAIAGAVVLWMVASLVLEALDGPGRPPDLRVTLAPKETDAEGRALLDFTLRNDGGRAASAVGVALRLDGPGGAALRRLVVDYVPPRSTVTGRFYLAPDESGGGAPVALVEGYVDP